MYKTDHNNIHNRTTNNQTDRIILFLFILPRVAFCVARIILFLFIWPRVVFLCCAMFFLVLSTRLNVIVRLRWKNKSELPELQLVGQL